MDERSIDSILQGMAQISAGYQVTTSNAAALSAAMMGGGAYTVPAVTPMPAAPVMMPTMPPPVFMPPPPPLPPPPMMPPPMMPPMVSLPMMPGMPPPPGAGYGPTPPPPPPPPMAPPPFMPPMPPMPPMVGFDSAYGAPDPTGIPLFHRVGIQTPYARPYDAAVQFGRQMSNLGMMDRADAMELSSKFFAGAAASTIGAGIGTVGGAALGTLFPGLGPVTGAGLGGMAGGMLLAPMIADSTMVQGAARAMLRPAMERTIDIARLRGITSRAVVGGDSLDITGRGMSARGAESMLTDLENVVQKSGGNMTRRDIIDLTGVAADAGLLELSQNKDQIVKVVGQVAGMLGTMAQITGDPDFKRNVRLIATLQQQGIEIGNMANVLKGVSDSARMGGVDVNTALSTSGVMGANVFARTGITRGVGMVQGVDIAGMARQAVGAGAFDEQMLALLGGQEGVTQRMMTAQAQFLQNSDSFLPYLIKRGGGGKLEIDPERLTAFRRGDITIPQMMEQAAQGLSPRDLQNLITQGSRLKDDMARQLGGRGMQTAVFRQMERINEMTGGLTTPAATALSMFGDSETAELYAQLYQSSDYHAALANQDRISAEQRLFETADARRARIARYGAGRTRLGAMGSYLWNSARYLSGYDAVTGAYADMNEGASDFYVESLAGAEMGAVGRGYIKRGRGYATFASGRDAQGRLTGNVAEGALGPARSTDSGMPTMQDVMSVGASYGTRYIFDDRIRNAYDKMMYGATENELLIAREHDPRWFARERDWASLVMGDRVDYRGKIDALQKTAADSAEGLGDMDKLRSSRDKLVDRVASEMGISKDEAKRLVHHAARTGARGVSRGMLGMGDVEAADFDEIFKYIDSDNFNNNRAGYTSAQYAQLQGILRKERGGLAAAMSMESSEARVAFQKSVEVGDTLTKAGIEGDYLARGGGGSMQRLQAGLKKLGLGGVGSDTVEEGNVAGLLASRSDVEVALMAFIALQESGELGAVNAGKKIQEYLNGGGSDAENAKRIDVIADLREEVLNMSEAERRALAKMGWAGGGTGGGVASLASMVKGVQTNQGALARQQADSTISAAAKQAGIKGVTGIDDVSSALRGASPAAREKFYAQFGSSRGDVAAAIGKMSERGGSKAGRLALVEAASKINEFSTEAVTPADIAGRDKASGIDEIMARQAESQAQSTAEFGTAVGDFRRAVDILDALARRRSSDVDVPFATDNVFLPGGK